MIVAGAPITLQLLYFMYLGLYRGQLSNNSYNSKALLDEIPQAGIQKL